MEGFFYEDDMFFTFSDPKDSAHAAVQGLDDIMDPTHSKLIAQIAKDMRVLTEEEKKSMSEEELTAHDE